MGLEYDRNRDEIIDEWQRKEGLPGNDALKLVVLERIMTEFEAGVVYTKDEVDAVIQDRFDDHVTVRRELVNFGYMGYDNRANEYEVRTHELTEEDVREISRLEHHAEAIGLLD